MIPIVRSSSFNSYLLHCVFSTKDRVRFLTADIAPRLWDYLAATARATGIKIFATGGTEDHVHVLISPPATMSPAKAMQVLKANSSRWLRDTFPKLRLFSWQDGYGAFSVGVSQVPATVSYIQNQREHHRRIDSRQEFARFLKKHGIELPSNFG
jgi:REP-associated tyrosine transposase